MAEIFDATIAVIADDAVREQRAAARGTGQLEGRSSRQLSQDEKAALATFVVHNDGDLERSRAARRALAAARRRGRLSGPRPGPLAARRPGKRSAQAARTPARLAAGASRRAAARRPAASGARAAGSGRAPSRHQRLGIGVLLLGSASATGRQDRRRRDAERDHPAAAARGHHPPAGGGEGRRGGPDRGCDLRRVALLGPDLRRRRPRPDADHARDGRHDREPLRRRDVRLRGPLGSRPQHPLRHLLPAPSARSSTTATRSRRSPPTTPGAATSTPGAAPRWSSTTSSSRRPRLRRGRCSSKRDDYRETYGDELGL